MPRASVQQLRATSFDYGISKPLSGVGRGGNKDSSVRPPAQDLYMSHSVCLSVCLSPCVASPRVCCLLLAQASFSPQVPQSAGSGLSSVRPDRQTDTWPETPYWSTSMKESFLFHEWTMDSPSAILVYCKDSAWRTAATVQLRLPTSLTLLSVVNESLQFDIRTTSMISWLPVYGLRSTNVFSLAVTVTSSTSNSMGRLPHIKLPTTPIWPNRRIFGIISANQRLECLEECGQWAAWFL